MTINPNLVQHGTAGGTAINVDVARIDHGATPVKVTLSANYVTLHPPGIPTRPGLTGTATTSLDYPKTILSGTTVLLSKAEADALVTAGKASYA